MLGPISSKYATARSRAILDRFREELRAGGAAAGDLDQSPRGRVRPRRAGRIQPGGVWPAPASNAGASAGLGAFAYAEVNVERACSALLMAEANGPLVITVNEKTVYQSSAVADRAGARAPEVARCDLVRPKPDSGAQPPGGRSVVL